MIFPWMWLISSSNRNDYPPINTVRAHGGSTTPPHEVTDVTRAAGNPFTRTVIDPSAIWLPGKHATKSVIRAWGSPIVITFGEQIPAIGVGTPSVTAQVCRSEMRAAGNPTIEIIYCNSQAKSSYISGRVGLSNQQPCHLDEHGLVF